MNRVRIQHRNSNASEGDGSVGSASCTLLAGLEGILKIEVDDQIVSSTSNILRMWHILKHLLSSSMKHQVMTNTLGCRPRV